MSLNPSPIWLNKGHRKRGEKTLRDDRQEEML